MRESEIFLIGNGCIGKKMTDNKKSFDFNRNVYRISKMTESHCVKRFDDF